MLARRKLLVYGCALSLIEAAVQAPQLYVLEHLDLFHCFEIKVDAGARRKVDDDLVGRVGFEESRKVGHLLIAFAVQVVDVQPTTGYSLGPSNQPSVP